MYINSVSENDTQALLQLQVDSGQVTAHLLCKIDTGAEGNVIPVDIYKRLCPQSSYSPEGTPLGLSTQRRVPEALHEPLKRELDALVEQGIIAKVDEPTNWVNSLVCMTKANGTL